MHEAHHEHGLVESRTDICHVQHRYGVDHECYKQSMTNQIPPPVNFGLFLDEVLARQVSCTEEGEGRHDLGLDRVADTYVVQVPTPEVLSPFEYTPQCVLDELNRFTDWI